MSLVLSSEREPMTRSQFDAALRIWVASGADPEVGDGRHGQTPGYGCDPTPASCAPLNAYTTRRGVTAYLALAASRPRLEWAIVRNRRGQDNKVAFGTGRQPIRGFYLYRPLGV